MSSYPIVGPKTIKLPANILALHDYYADSENLRVMDYKKTRAGEFVLVGHVENTDNGEEFFAFQIYRCDKNTGRRCGYIGSDLCTLRRGDSSESWITNQAKALFKAA